MTTDIDESDEEAQEEAPKKSSTIKTLLFSVLAAVFLGGAAAGAIFFLPVRWGECKAVDGASGYAKEKTKSYEDTVFVNLEPLVITLGPNAASEYLKISISLETYKDHVKTIDHLRPRFRDVLNTYLRAVDENDLVEPSAMTRLRAQMLRRLQVVASSEIVTDVLITDFVLN